MNESNWGTMEDAARYLGVSSKTIRRRIADGTIRAKKFGPRLVRVDMTSLEQSGRSMSWNAA
ncbi:helix-turn-helix domain-containing protein [Microbacterium sp. WCS2018Hpa-9]|uniref:helix-turn-helix domain-containing protein n=1 Tax=Microbacterium sp. WCS2018Hpa-9 TaxID=3073635 RepID=UPI00288A1676|nr:helix-turn-helix domain-containing protein [Microbacterium sp. WCS2018Hpa-9]